ncbi:MAG: GNAT family N-acetyltransferase [Janthinobacterium lividum]
MSNEPQVGTPPGVDRHYDTHHDAPHAPHASCDAAVAAVAAAGGGAVADAPPSHPLRPARRPGLIYQRDLPGEGLRFTLHTATVADHLDHLHRWMNDPRVNAFWEEAGSRDAHRAYLEKVLADPHMHPLIGAFNGEPFAYFEAYWAKEDRIGPFADPEDYDRGVHMLVGEARWRGPQRVAAWLPSLTHYLFEGDARTRSVFCEPRHDNAKMIGYLQTHGFAFIRHFDFPHKRAALMQARRETFFSKDRPSWPHAVETSSGRVA